MSPEIAALNNPENLWATETVYRPDLFKGKVALTGLGTPNQMRDYVLDGTVTAFALWNPGDLGYLAAYAAKALIDGDITGAEGDEFDAGKLGKPMRE